ncbi:MAG: oligosaccharide flippase family protein, partial [Thermoplasmata archaeon]|nr:oligosaccharide flippase family protein [Thermoplasmata archaeon]
MSTTTKKKIAKNTLAVAIMRAWTWVISFLLLPFMVYYLGPIGFGIWAIANVVTGYFGIIDFGIAPGIAKYVAEYHALEDRKKLNAMINSTFFLYLGIGTTVFLLLLLLGEPILSIFRIEAAYKSQARAVIYLLASSLLFGFSFRIFSAALGGIQRYDLASALTMVSTGVTAVVTVVVLLMGFGLVELVFATVVFGLVKPLLGSYFLQRCIPYIDISISKTTRTQTRSILAFSGMMFPIQILISLVLQIDQLIVGALLSVELVTFYVVAWKIYQGVSRLPGISISTFVPVASEMDARKEKERKKKLFIRGTKYYSAITLCLALPVMIYTEPILRYWVGEDFVQYSIITRILILHLLLVMNHQTAVQILTGMNKLRLVLYFYVALFALTLASSIALSFFFGMTGVALGRTIPFFLLEGAFMWGILRILNVPAREFLSGVLSRVYPSALLAAIPLVLLGVMIPEPSLPVLLLLLMMSALLVLVLFYFTGLEKGEKSDLKKLVGSFASVLRPKRKVEHDEQENGMTKET